MSYNALLSATYFRCHRRPIVRLRRNSMTSFDCYSETVYLIGRRLARRRVIGRTAFRDSDCRNETSYVIGRPVSGGGL